MPRYWLGLREASLTALEWTKGLPMCGTRDAVSMV
jgi:hypothetical protein